MRSIFIATLFATSAAAAQKLTLEEQKALYERVTGPYCDQYAYTEPQCSHRAEELSARKQESASKQESQFKKPKEFCARFPARCENANRLKINPETRFIVDFFGRSTLLHGVNVVYKVSPYIPSDAAFDAENSLNEEDI